MCQENSALDKLHLDIFFAWLHNFVYQRIIFWTQKLHYIVLSLSVKYAQKIYLSVLAFAWSFNVAKETFYVLAETFN